MIVVNNIDGTMLIELTQEESVQFVRLMDSFNGKGLQPEIHMNPYKSNPYHAFKKSTSSFFDAVTEKFGDKWVDVKDEELIEMKWLFHIQQLGASLTVLEGRGFCQTERGDRNRIKKFRLITSASN